MTVTEYPKALRRAAMRSAADAQAESNRLPTKPSPHVGDDTPAGRVALFLDGHLSRSGADPELITSVATPVTGGEMADLNVSDLRELVSPEQRALLVIRTELARHLIGGELAGIDELPNYGPVFETVNELDTQALSQLSIVLSEMHEVVARAFTDRRLAEIRKAKQS
jgi:hypothetical protein